MQNRKHWLANSTALIRNLTIQTSHRHIVKKIYKNHKIPTFSNVAVLIMASCGVKEHIDDNIQRN